MRYDLFAWRLKFGNGSYIADKSVDNLYEISLNKFFGTYP